MRRFTAWAIALLVSAGCASPIPATTPPQLQHTMGAVVRLDDNFFYAEMFTVRYPQGWRIVKLNPSVEPLRLAMISPDDTLYIVLDTQPIRPEDYPIAGARTTQTTRTLSDGSTLYALGIAPEAAWQPFLTTFARVLDSLMPPR